MLYLLHFEISQDKTKVCNLTSFNVDDKISLSSLSLSLSLSRKLHQSLKHDESKDLCANVGLPQFKTKTQVKLLCRLKKQNLDVFDSKATVQCQSLLQRKSLGPNISGQPTSIKQDLP